MNKMNLSTLSTLNTCAFIRKSLKSGRKKVFNQHYASIVSDELFNIISTELNVNGNVCKILDKNFQLLKNIEKNHKTNLIRNLKTIDVSIKIGKQTISTISLVI